MGSLLSEGQLLSGFIGGHSLLALFSEARYFRKFKVILLKTTGVIMFFKQKVTDEVNDQTRELEIKGKEF